MYFGDDYVIGDKIRVKQPTIGQILEKGEDQVYATVNIFVANTTMYRVFLWDNGIDWNKITDFELFTFLLQSIDKEYSDLLFDDIDFTHFKTFQRALPNPAYTGENEEPENLIDTVLYNKEQDIMIDESVYLEMREYIREMFNIHPKNEFAKGKTTKQWMIQEDKDKIEKHKNDQSSSVLFSLISTCVNHPGFKYKLQELRDVGIIQFMDSVNRLQVYEQSGALLKGLYSGMIDGSKIPAENTNFFRDIYAKDN